jgi:hypothetical protein
LLFLLFLVACIRLRPKAGFGGQMQRSDMRSPGFRHSASKTRVNALMAHPGYDPAGYAHSFACDLFGRSQDNSVAAE